MIEDEENKENKIENNTDTTNDQVIKEKDSATTVAPTDNEAETDDSKKESGLPRALVGWRTAVQTAVNTSQIALAYQQLEHSIAWDKSIMKVGINTFDI